MVYSNNFLVLYGLQIVILEEASFVSKNERTKTHSHPHRTYMIKKQTRKGLKATKEHTASRTGASKNMLVFTWNHLPRNKNRQVINI